MANCSDLFKKYNAVIKLTDEKREILISVRNNLRDRIREGYKYVDNNFNHGHLLEFQSQGSFVSDTIIEPIRRDYDLDDGIYFIGKMDKDSRPSPEEFHTWICQAIDKGYDDIEKIKDKITCVRVLYKEGFHVDLPIYYADNMDSPDLADKSKGWILSNPVEFIAWFESKIESGFQKAYLTESGLYNEYKKWSQDIRKKDVQLRRIVRYLKSWGDLRREEMPCGLVMTILVANNYYSHQRDDIALKETLVNIEAELTKSFKCERPTTPIGEDLLMSYSNKNAFMRYLRNFIEDSKKALAEPNQLQACKYWQNSLGERFSCDGAVDRILTSSTVSSLAAGASDSRPWITYE